MMLPEMQAMRMEYSPSPSRLPKPNSRHFSPTLDDLSTMEVPQEIGTEKSMDLTNDPRFMAPNILEKRLFAFTGPATIVSGLLTSTSLKLAFRLEKDLHFGICEHTPYGEILRSAVQICAFLVMTSVVFMSLFSTLVCVYQAYFTYRLMTAGTNGFELARCFYLHPGMTYRRHMAITLLGWGLVLVLAASGGMLYVMFGRDGFAYPKATLRRRNDWLCQTLLPILNPLGLLVFIIFVAGSIFLHQKIMAPSRRLFDLLYAQRSAEEMQWWHSNYVEPFLAVHDYPQPGGARPPLDSGCAIS